MGWSGCVTPPHNLPLEGRSRAAKPLRVGVTAQRIEVCSLSLGALETAYAVYPRPVAACGGARPPLKGEVTRGPFSAYERSGEPH